MKQTVKSLKFKLGLYCYMLRCLLNIDSVFVYCFDDTGCNTLQKEGTLLNRCLPMLLKRIETKSNNLLLSASTYFAHSNDTTLN